MKIDSQTIYMIVAGVATIGAAWGITYAGVMTLKRVVFRDHGELNFVPPQQCRENRTDCQTSVCRKIDALSRQLMACQENVNTLLGEVRQIAGKLN